MRDVIAQMGDAFWRLRIGIGHPGGRAAVLDYVLGRPPAADALLIHEALLAAADIVPLLLTEGAQIAMKPSAQPRIRTGRPKGAANSEAPGRGSCMPIRCGIVGLPMSASRLCSTRSRAHRSRAENYPFCTNRSERPGGPVPDPRLAQLAAIAQPEKSFGPRSEFVASQVWSPAPRRARTRQSVSVAHPRSGRDRARGALLRERRRHPCAGRIDPLSDVEIIDTELALADLATLEKGWNAPLRRPRAASRMRFAGASCLNASECS